ncbi:hypothetical protein G5V58_11840 [Nocardioides anomalus]|uniref:Uncharacterized protein n=1 Tax=Nocardioides anomalus TaxID=2712223 RepID=A0A6G6WE36_9ACTN|nr:hypothetical protein [Nocardioides anomalus]QIG43365.1 hypothetical protein G5V58_11840 [Nocardioides anomalus]
MRTDLVWRASVPVAAVVAEIARAPRPLTGALVVVGLGLAAERLAERRGTATTDRVLVGLGGTLVTLVLTGVVLDVTGVGLRPASWTVALALLALAGLGLAARLNRRGDAQPTREVRTGLHLLPWVAASIGVTVLAVHLSATSLSAADAQPLQLSLGKVSASAAQVVVSSSDAVGPLELRTTSEGSEVSYPLLDVPEDGSRTVTVPMPRSGRVVITLGYPDQTEPLRTLVLDR